MKKILFLSFLVSLCANYLFAQGASELYSREWKQYDSLMAKGLPKSAKAIADKVYKQAKEKSQQPQMIKAQLYILQTNFQIEEEAGIESIKTAESEIKTTSFPSSAIWQSIAAQLYWNYYTTHRWEILNRTSVSAATEISDIKEWDASRFYNKVSSLYLASIGRAEELKSINISSYDPILDKGKNTRHLRPTLYDFLAFRALNYFENDEKDLTRPAFQFELRDETDFADAATFINKKFISKDTSSLQYKAILVYQDLLRMHMNDTKHDAFLDADLQRLRFVYNKSVHADKKQLYRAALQRIENRYTGNSLAGLASYRIAELMSTDNYYGYRSSVPPIDTTDFVAVKTRLDNIVAKYPNSEAAALASNMLYTITQKFIQVQSEYAVLPNEPSKIMVMYKNTPRVWLRLVRINYELLTQQAMTNGREQKILGLSPIKTWDVSLPATEDFKVHTTELPIDALPIGSYAIITSSTSSFDKKTSNIVYTQFQVTNLSIVNEYSIDNVPPSKENLLGYILHRKTGEPINNVKVHLMASDYRNNSYSLRTDHTTETKNDGTFNIKVDNRAYNGVLVISGKDSLYINTYIQTYRNNAVNNTVTQTIFFTDRAIYRPGQTLYFKGIMLNIEDRGRKNEVKAGQTTVVTFFDNNGQKISSQNFVTNEFGSFSGTFVIPEGFLTGTLRMANESGDRNFQVEEYKRPRFEVSFDTLNKEYALNETVTLKGNATAYAGYNLDGATVKYRVMRQARWPYYWMYDFWRPMTPPVEITNGIAKTNTDGSFTVSFLTIPDKTISEKSAPIFTYTIVADVTDINGETHSATTSINAGYHALQISTTVPEQAVTPRQLETISVITQNLNGGFVPATATINVKKLQSPGKIYRKRLWQQPDQYVMDEATFRNLFPLDEYKDEADYRKWAEGQQVYNKQFTTTKEGIINLPSDIWNINGWYVVTTTARDKNGKEVMDKKYVQVWDKNKNTKAEEALVVVPQEQKKAVGETAEVAAFSGYSSAFVLQAAKNYVSADNVQSYKLNGTAATWQRQITGNDRGGILLSYLMVKENRFYIADAKVNVSWTDKELNITWATHRDKLKPGEKEKWTMNVSGAMKDKVAAEMVATLYDASLDALVPNKWDALFFFPGLSTYAAWTPHNSFNISEGHQLSSINDYKYRNYEKEYDALLLLGNMGGGMYYYRGRKGYIADGAAMNEMSGARNVAPPAAPVRTQALSMDVANAKEEAVQTTSTDASVGQSPDVQVRKNLAETAFFFPQLRTNENGDVSMEFTMPEALTEWKLMAFAHTKDMRHGYFEGTVKTQKDLMVVPGLPRFLRQGDDIAISTKISNLSGNDLNGTAKIEILHALTLKPLDLPFRISNASSSFSVTKGGSTTTSWNVHVPEALYEPVVIRISATAGNFTDAEENTLPVITNRTLVTETLPIWIHGNGEKTFDYTKLRNSDTSKTLSQYNISVEYTGNPAWYAVQALPYLMEYPHDCAEQVFNRYYAAALGAYIVDKAPRIKEIFSKWQQLDTMALLSNLEKNQDLKSALLQETPWVMQAKNETQRKKNIAMLFDAVKLSRTLNENAKKLREMQLPDGSFPWFRGMLSDRYITQYIVAGMARLKHLGVRTNDVAENVTAKALPYLDGQVANDYNNLKKIKDVKLSDQHIYYMQIHYLYMRSFYSPSEGRPNKEAYEYYKGQAAKYWTKFNPYSKGMIALAMHRSNNKTVANEIIASLKETAINNTELGMYWKQEPGYWWYQAPIESQALLIETFTEIANDINNVDAMKVWLLKQKQTQNWPTTKATADACYALLLSGSQWLQNDPQVKITLGNKMIDTKEMKTEAGTGYFRVNYNNAEIKPEMGNIKLAVSGNEHSTSWGAVYWQYFEDLDKITRAATPLSVTKRLFIQENTARGPELKEVASGYQLHTGDKVVMRITISTDRDMEYVHLKDMRASCFEPVNVLSGYKWGNGLGYYESTRDVSSNFFFNYLRKGTHVLEYPVFVTNKGDFSNGITTIQCMYAPEFSSHTERIRITVK
jgi:uncharacterized protein YfaS (alpha-2-macroglobulin family)